MPRVHGQSKQKNKPFKGKSNKNKDNKIASTKTKHIAKKTSNKRIKTHRNELLKDKKMKKIQHAEKLTNENEYLDQQTKSIIT